ncbi:hypothetical protein [Cyclobacterium qasimii]|uniref:Uncharacterized protein n=2 Tax=Cyclobacterium qasimii TaxID=1350429 RepID=S7WGZ2_9BACT|nr:hypothetical protein [Cyclobacterium qasimii]EPR66024.1 hypothetical protein ADICYQ_4968 [Cyclobacterium qasimii M12-11B]GEO20059.1 hypothetical protein CQA01_05930 [Cyclobacterium qasimii]
MKAIAFILLLGCYSIQEAMAQKDLFHGQASIVSSYSPKNDLPFFFGARYIPELRINSSIDSVKNIDIVASANISSTVLFSDFNSTESNFSVNPYRVWLRYSSSQFELRLGLQKIDFGSAAVLRPLQWFNQIDPRDPLQLTNGVYGIMGRYTFLNNANIRLWGLYGNEKARGFDVVPTNKAVPEFGGRIQNPVPKGELAFSYHHRVANSITIGQVNAFDKIPENRFGLDGKWDLGVGLWFESVYVHRNKDLGNLTNQTLLNIGVDYTFPVGTGLNAVLEHMQINFDEENFAVNNALHVTAATLMYPLSFFDNLTTVMYYDWNTDNTSFFINYSHQFKKLTGYVMGYYNPESIQQGIQQNEFVNQFKGPGLRLMLVYNH